MKPKTKVHFFTKQDVGTLDKVTYSHICDDLSDFSVVFAFFLCFIFLPFKNVHQIYSLCLLFKLQRKKDAYMINTEKMVCSDTMNDTTDLDVTNTMTWTMDLYLDLLMKCLGNSLASIHHSLNCLVVVSII